MLLVAKPSKAPSGKACSDHVAGSAVLLYRNKKIYKCSLILLMRLSCSLFSLAPKKVVDERVAPSSARLAMLSVS